VSASTTSVAVGGGVGGATQGCGIECPGAEAQLKQVVGRAR
jgi:hypothetical protein